MAHAGMAESAIHSTTLAVEILEQIHGVEHSLIDDAYEQLANALQQVGSFEQAAPFHQLAMEGRSTKQGQLHRFVW